MTEQETIVREVNATYREMLGPDWPDETVRLLLTADEVKEFGEEVSAWVVCARATCRGIDVRVDDE